VYGISYNLKNELIIIFATITGLIVSTVFDLLKASSPSSSSVPDVAEPEMGISERVSGRNSEETPSTFKFSIRSLIKLASKIQ